MPSHLLEIATNIVTAWAAGSLVGLERSYNGRAAGFRTHALVALAAASAMVIPLEPSLIPGAFGPGVARLDPTHLAQGVMTGVGFLGAGVIFKEGVSVQGLTTAACLWVTSAIGLLCGAGLYAAAALTTAAVLITLIGMRTIETAAPGHVYAMATFRFRADGAPSEAELKALLGEHEVSLSDLSYRLSDGGKAYEYQGSLKTRRKSGLASLASRLRATPGLLEYELARISK